MNPLKNKKTKADIIACLKSVQHVRIAASSRFNVISFLKTTSCSKTFRLNAKLRYTPQALRLSIPQSKRADKPLDSTTLAQKNNFAFHNP